MQQDKIREVFDALVRHIIATRVDSYGKDSELYSVQTRFKAFLHSPDSETAADIRDRLADLLTSEGQVLSEDEEQQLSTIEALMRQQIPAEKGIVEEEIVPSSLRHSTRWWDYDVLAICALYDPELKAFVNRLEDPEEQLSHANDPEVSRTYYTGFLTCKDGTNSRLRVAAFFLDKTGMVDCAALTAWGIRYFNPRMVVMPGVCAGREAMKVEKGDLIAPSEVFTFDTGKYTDKDFEPEPRWSSIKTTTAQRVTVRAEEILREVSDEFRENSGEKIDPSLHTDVMACGSAVVDRKHMLDEIAKGRHRKIVGLEMESYAVLRTLELIDQRIIGLVVKCVMDSSTEKTDSIKKKAAILSAMFLEKFLRYEFKNLIV